MKMNPSPLRISAKHLGSLALPDACPRCFWLQAKMNFKTPYAVFPGIFSSIDSYSKKITHLTRNRSGHLPAWLENDGISGDPISGLHHSTFQSIESDFRILLTGVPDEIIRSRVGLFILDYKTSRHTDGQDALKPMYELQLNAYARIAEKLGMEKVKRLALIYYEPITDIGPDDIPALANDDGFAMRFHPQIVPVELQPEIIPPLLKQAREIFDSPNPPLARDDCKNCELVERMATVLQSGRRVDI